MNKKIAIASVITILVILIILIILYFVTTKPIFSNGPEIELTADNIISDPAVFDLIVNKMISPNGSNLTKMILDEDNPNIMDESWKTAFYACNDNEHLGWIYYYPGGDKAKPELYGPFDWCLI